MSEVLTNLWIAFMLVLAIVVVRGICHFSRRQRTARGEHK